MADWGALHDKDEIDIRRSGSDVIRSQIDGLHCHLSAAP